MHFPGELIPGKVGSDTRPLNGDEFKQYPLGRNHAIKSSLIRARGALQTAQRPPGSRGSSLAQAGGYQHGAERDLPLYSASFLEHSMWIEPHGKFGLRGGRLL